jgi:multiple sugar transport system ATP-binding protein
MTNVNLQNITKRFEDITALNEVTFAVEDGEFFVLLGPTGAGKTTTLRVISGLERQDEGSILFDDEIVDEVMPADRDVAFVFQQYSLYPTMSVFDNLAFPLRSPLRRMSKDDVRQRVEQAAEMLRIGHLLERKTANLSGGEMQRVSIGRAIVREPRIFLMDEPLSNLDAKLREALRVELQHLQRAQGSTTLFVTHDQVEALTMADRIAVLNEGKIIQIGTPNDIYDRPASMFVAQLIGTPGINLLPASRENGNLRIDNSPIQFPLGPATEKLPSNFIVGVRPEDIQPQAGGEYGGEATLIEPLGVETILHIKSGNQILLSTVSGMANWSIGDSVQFNIVHEHLHYFDKSNESRISGARQAQLNIQPG